MLNILNKDLPVPAGLVAAVTAWTRQDAPLNLPAGQQVNPGQVREPVFSPDVMAFVSQPDPVFAEHGFMIASQARGLMNRLIRDLEAADVNTQHQQPAHGAAFLPVFAETNNALLARLRADQ
jgi:hypothetical protein